MSSKANKGDKLGDRMKSYEAAFKQVLPRRLPIIIRLDGVGFSEVCRKLAKPFDDKFINLMNETTLHLCKEIGDVVFAYTQSDEISLLIHGFRQRNSEPWFGNQVQKMVSVAASKASSFFAVNSTSVFEKQRTVAFDARVMLLPDWEVNNAFYWRQNDNVRNSVQMLARSMYSHAACSHKNIEQLKTMCNALGKPWEQLEVKYQRGRCFYRRKESIFGLNKKTGETVASIRSKWFLDENAPIFIEDKNYINQQILFQESINDK